MHSGRGEEVSDNTYRLLPIPQEPHVPAAADAREGVVLPAPSDQWEQPTQVVQPAPGQPWGAPQHSPAPGPAGPGAGDADADKTQLIAPYGGPDGEKTRLMEPPGAPAAEPARLMEPPGAADGEKTQLIAPYRAVQGAAPAQAPAAQGPQGAESTQLLPPYPAQAPQQAPQPPHQPLPPEQGFGPAAPQGPVAPVGQPPMPQGAPFGIRPGAPADQPPPQYGEGAAAPTQALPPYAPPAQQPLQAQVMQPPQDDYDFLYRQDGRTAPAAPPTAAYAAPNYGYGQPAGGPGADPGAAAGGGSGRFGRLSPRAVIGIVVAACAVVGLAAGAILSGGGGTENAGSASPAGSAPAQAAGAGDAAAQAKALDALLAASSGSREQVIGAVQAIKTCGDLAQAASELQTAAAQRRSLVTRLAQLQVDKLPNHDELVARLDTGWQASAAADEHYAAWAGQAQCKGGHAKPSAEAQAGNASSGEATIAKKAAADLWNPIAQQYGLTQRQYGDL